MFGKGSVKYKAGESTDRQLQPSESDPSIKGKEELGTKSLRLQLRF